MKTTRIRQTNAGLVLPLVWLVVWLAFGVPLIVAASSQLFASTVFVVFVLLGVTFLVRLARVSVSLRTDRMIVRNVFRSYTVRPENITRIDRRRLGDYYAPALLVQLDDGESIAVHVAGIGRYESARTLARLDRNQRILDDWLGRQRYDMNASQTTDNR